MKRVLVISAVLAAGLAGCASMGGGGTPTGIQGVTILEEGQQSAVKHMYTVDVHNDDDMKKLWVTAYADDKNAPAMPKVDWTKNMVVAYFTGSLPTSGYWIKVTRAEEVVGAYDVDFTVTVPGPGCHANEVTTHAYIIAQVPVSAMPVSITNRSQINPPCN